MSGAGSREPAAVPPRAPSGTAPGSLLLLMRSARTASSAPSAAPATPHDSPPPPPPPPPPPAHLGTAFVTELRGGREWGSARMTGHRGRNLTGRNPKGSVLYFSWPLTSPCVGPSLRPSDGRPLPRPGARQAHGRAEARR